MRAYEFTQSKPLYCISLGTELQVIGYMKSRAAMLREHYGIDWTLQNNWRSASSAAFKLFESRLPDQQNQLLQLFNSLDEYKSLNIRVGSKVAILNAELGGDSFTIWGSTTPKTITKIFYTDDEDKIKKFQFNNDPNDEWPRVDNAEYNGSFISHSAFFGTKQSADHALTYLLLNKPDNINISTHLSESLNEGGWANPITQNTTITPALVNKAWAIMKNFEDQANQYIESKGLPPMEISGTAGSSTYYKRDLEKNPTKEYGDIDVNLLVPKLPDMTNNANFTTYQKLIKEFCDGSNDYQTQNGTNVIFRIGADYVQVDLVMSFYDSKEWVKALAPEWNVKGVLCNSLYSSLGEALNISMGGGLGVQVKTINNIPVKFSTQKGVQLSTITLNPKTWAVDIARYFGAKQLSQRLQSYPGMMDEIRTADIIQSIIGIAETLEMNGLLGSRGLSYSSAQELVNTISSIYLAKIDKAINSSKFDKAETPAAIKKAADTKNMLATKSHQIAAQFRL